jgi:hypothetical protein
MIDSTFTACVTAMIEAAERHLEVRAFHDRYNARWRQTHIDTNLEGIATEDFPAQLDAELAALALVGPIFDRRLMAIEPFDPERVAKLIDSVLGGSPSLA